MLTFRGNPTRSYYGEGPVPAAPKILWRFPASGGLCHTSTDQHGARVWCGTGWTGQANVWTNPKDGKLWLAFGAYDAAYHFLDPATGERKLPDFPTGDIDKGSATVDPDGFPLYYAGSRDNNLRVIALDRDIPTELWRLPANAVSPTHVEQRLGRRAARHRRLLVRRRREQPVPHREAEPRRTGPTAR